MSKKQFWMVKQEPEDYSWADLMRDGKTDWTGVRNFQARNNLRAMKKGDAILYYHTGLEKQVVGIAEVSKEFFADTTATEGDWSAVEIKPVKSLKKGVTLEAIKQNPKLQNMALIRQSRLSVLPLTKEEFDEIVRMQKRDRQGACIQ
jgi:predicted RNA-binding protein with PUA-like domain